VSSTILLAGYDPRLVARLTVRHARFFGVASVLTIVAAVVVGVGAGYGAELVSDSIIMGIAVGVAAALVMLNLYRLFHAGTGFPIHWPIEALDRWSPSWVGIAVFVVLGGLISQPDVLLVMKPLIDDQVALLPVDGLVSRTRAAWSHPIVAIVATAWFAMLSSLPAWLRRIMHEPVRAYEQERWLDERMLVDDAFAEAQDDITQLLTGIPGFSGALQVHYADPPYNTRPLIFGFDLFARSDGKFIVTDEPAPPQLEPAPLPKRAETPAPVHLPALPTPPPPDVAAPSLSWDDPKDDHRIDAPVALFFDMGRSQVKRAQQHLDEVAPFLSRFVGISVEEVQRLVTAAPPEARLHEVIPGYKSVRAIVLQNAGFALDHGLAPILAIITEKPVEDVEKRLRAAPRDRRLSGVFTAELARRLLPPKR
jgi:hypothetical protein